MFFTASFTLRYVLVQHKRGNRLIWKTPISQYNPRAISEFITDDPSFQWVSAGSDPNARRTGDWAAFEKI